MRELIEVLTASVAKHGRDKPLTIGHLLNIAQMAENAKFKKEEQAAEEEANFWNLEAQNIGE